MRRVVSADDAADIVCAVASCHSSVKSPADEETAEERRRGGQLRSIVANGCGRVSRRCVTEHGRRCSIRDAMQLSTLQCNATQRNASSIVPVVRGAVQRRGGGRGGADGRGSRDTTEPHMGE